MTCQVQDCNRPGFWEGVCSQHHWQAHHAYTVKVLREVERDYLIETVPIKGDAPTGRLKIHRLPLSWQSRGATPYGQAVLKTQATKVALATHPGRNEVLNRAAYVVGGYVAGGELSLDRATEALFEAARICGLKLDEARSTIRSGLRKGMQRPLNPRPQIR